MDETPYAFCFDTLHLFDNNPKLFESMAALLPDNWADVAQANLDKRKELWVTLKELPDQRFEVQIFHKLTHITVEQFRLLNMSFLKFKRFSLLLESDPITGRTEEVSRNFVGGLLIPVMVGRMTPDSKFTIKSTNHQNLELISPLFNHQYSFIKLAIGTATTEEFLMRQKSPKNLTLIGNCKNRQNLEKWMVEFLASTDGNVYLVDSNMDFTMEMFKAVFDRWLRNGPSAINISARTLLNRRELANYRSDLNPSLDRTGDLSWKSVGKGPFRCKLSFDANQGPLIFF